MKEQVKVIFCICIMSIVAVADNVKKATLIQDIPKTFQMVKHENVMDLAPFTRAALIWPTEEIIKEQFVRDESSKDEIESTLQWLKTVLRAEYIPLKDSLTVIPLKSHIEQCDVIRFRYQVNNCVFQITSTSSSFMIAIKDMNSKQAIKRQTKEDVVVFVESNIQKYLNDSSEIKKHLSSEAKKTKGGYRCFAEMGRNPLNSWHGLINWWSDGNVILYKMGKADGGALAPTLIKDWYQK